MFDFGIVNTIRVGREWYVSFRCDCHQCAHSQLEASTWKYPWLQVLKGD